jgi:prepilin-type N-terminal cleavage/methylation domain-containing protein
MRNIHRDPRRSRNGFTLVEALAALTILVMASSVILLSLETAVNTAVDGVESTIAEGLADQIIVEVLGRRYKAFGTDAYQYPLGPSSWEQQGNGRERFNDTDDFHSFVAEGAEDVWGLPLGTGDGEGRPRHPNFQVPAEFFKNWRQDIAVHYVNETDLSQNLGRYQTSNFRAVEVTISRRLADGTLRPLATRRRVFAYVPEP